MTYDIKCHKVCQYRYQKIGLITVIDLHTLKSFSMNKIIRKMQRNEMAIFPLYFQGISFIIFNKFVAGPLFKTSSAEAEISDGPHKGVLRRAGPNTKRSIYFNIFCFYLFVLLVMFSIFQLWPRSF